ncbi:hypothetical protein HPG69_006377, partial [Diceros bicornis minor]
KRLSDRRRKSEKRCCGVGLFRTEVKDQLFLEKEITSANEMLFLQIPLLAVLLPEFHEQVSFQIIQIASFYNQSWVQNLGSGWLGELQTHGWDSNSDTIIFLWPWSKGNFSNEDLTELGKLFHVFSIGFLQAFHNHASQWQLEYPFELQTTGGCELYFGESSTGFLRVAYQGSDFLHFQNNSWVPSPEGGNHTFPLSLSHFPKKEPKGKENHLNLYVCVRVLIRIPFLSSAVRPEAWLSTGSSPGPGRLMLVCHISGFHPKPIWVMWMRGEQEHLGTQPGDVLPNADRTWYLQVSLDVEAIEAVGLSCRVRHSRHHNSVVLIILAVIVPLVLLTGLAFWLRKR